MIDKIHEQIQCSWGQAWFEDSTSISGVSGLEIADENATRGYFSVNIEGLQENSTFCIVVELVDHPYCNSHLTIGHQRHHPIVCTNHVLQPVVLPKCTYRTPGPMVFEEWSGKSSRIVIGNLAGVMGILVMGISISIIYFCCTTRCV